MGLTAGIVGLPNVGKSTLFNAVTKACALVANYPFATIEPNVGLVEVRDERLERLAEAVKQDNIIRASFSLRTSPGSSRELRGGRLRQSIPCPHPRGRLHLPCGEMF